MSTTINLPVLLAQLPHLAKVTSTVQNSPETQAAFTERLAREAEARSKEQVQEVDKKDKSNVIGDEKGTSAEEQQTQSKRKKRKEEQAPEEEETLASTPWAGNIINMKI